MGGKGGRVANAFAPAGASREYLRIPGDALQPRNGRYVLPGNRELWETAYLDQGAAPCRRSPDSVDVFVDERFPPASGGLRLFQIVHQRPPLAAVDEHG